MANHRTPLRAAQPRDLYLPAVRGVALVDGVCDDLAADSRLPACARGIVAPQGWDRG
jgi:hypothetical protein